MNLIDSSSKVVLEKPIGNKLSSFEKINNQIASAFAENQIYRIDHYLGKETVQNLMVLRFSNHLFEKSWNRDHIDNIQITVAESIGVESRGNFYNGNRCAPRYGAKSFTTNSLFSCDGPSPCA